MIGVLLYMLAMGLEPVTQCFTDKECCEQTAQEMEAARAYYLSDLYSEEDADEINKLCGFTINKGVL